MELWKQKETRGNIHRYVNNFYNFCKVYMKKYLGYQELLFVQDDQVGEKVISSLLV